MRRKVSAVSAKESAHTAQASQEAIRMLIPPSLPCPCSLVPSVTTPLYSTIVSQALRQTLRSGVMRYFLELRHGELRRIHLPRTSVNKGRRLRSSSAALLLAHHHHGAV